LFLSRLKDYFPVNAIDLRMGFERHFHPLVILAYKFELFEYHNALIDLELLEHGIYLDVGFYKNEYIVCCSKHMP